MAGDDPQDRPRRKAQRDERNTGGGGRCDDGDLCPSEIIPVFQRRGQLVSAVPHRLFALFRRVKGEQHCGRHNVYRVIPVRQRQILIYDLAGSGARGSEAAYDAAAR